MISRLVVVSYLIGGLTACERPLKVTLDGRTPPTFRFDGSGELLQVGIYQVTPEGKVPPRGSEFWVIFPRKLVKALKAPSITYGVVPDEFYQKVPASGSPPPLQEGKIYGFGADTRGAPGNDIWFTIRDGKSIRVPKTDPADPEMR